MSEPTNEERAEAGSDVFNDYMAMDGTDDSSPQDIVTDLLHYLHHVKGYSEVDCRKVTQNALNNFLSEL